MTDKMHWRRILAGGFLSELSVFAVFIPATMFIGEVPGMYTAVAASLVMPFLFAMWVGRKLESRFVLHGLLVGSVGVLIYIGLSRAQPEPLLYIFGHGLKLLGGAAGGRVAEKRNHGAAL
jgi:hypothetical protein